jgi:FtsP/CotA-like multicopper oxidase with cupredoxin domain
MRTLLLPFAIASCLSVNAVGASQSKTSATSASTLAVANDNRNAAGAFAKGTLTLRLVAEEARWQPEGPDGRTLTVQIFREETGPPTIPGPLIRVPAGTEVHVVVRNNVPGTTLSVFGMRGRPATGPTFRCKCPQANLARSAFLLARPVRIITGRPQRGGRWGSGRMSTVS